MLQGHAGTRFGAPKDYGRVGIKALRCLYRDHI